MDSYTVQAVLTLKDNLSAGMRNAAASTESLGSKFKSARPVNSGRTPRPPHTTAE